MKHGMPRVGPKEFLASMQHQSAEMEKLKARNAALLAIAEKAKAAMENGSGARDAVGRNRVLLKATDAAALRAALAALEDK